VLGACAVLVLAVLIWIYVRLTRVPEAREAAL